MPYITDEYRDDINLIFQECEMKSLDDFLTHLAEYPEDKLAGIANYVVSSLIAKLIIRGKDKNYNRINSAIGVLECSKMELYRRVAAGYEDLAIKKNGDIEAYKPSA